MRRIAFLKFFLLLPILLSCRQAYFPDDLDSSEKIPVITGIITDCSSPEVTLSWATPFDDRNTISYISGAIVIVSDDLGNETSLYEVSEGKYTSGPHDFKGIPGRTYLLHVRLPDGNIYESSPVLINKKANIDSVYADISDTQIRKGLNLYISINIQSNSSCYFRFQGQATNQYTYWVYVNTPYLVPAFMWETSPAIDNEYDVQYSLPRNNLQVIPEHLTGYLDYESIWQLEEYNSTIPQRIGWVARLNVYSITKDVYDYYNSIAQQINGSGRIFSPIDNQIISNIHCVNSPTNKVTGVFEASSVAKAFKGLIWSPGEIQYTAKEILSYPDTITNGVSYFNPPYFWIRF